MNSTNKKSHLNLITHNINGALRDKIKDITELANKQDIDFFLLQEVKMKHGKSCMPYEKLKNHFYEENLLTDDMLSNKYVTKQKRDIYGKYKQQQQREIEINKINPRGFKTNGGLITLIHKRWQGKTTTYKDKCRRFMITTIKIENEIYLIANIYAPAGTSPRIKKNSAFLFTFITGYIKSIIKKLKRQMEISMAHIIIGGDMNVVMNLHLDRQVPQWQDI